MHNFHLLAFCMPIFLFIYWGIIGYASLTVLCSQRNILQNLLIAPTIGMAFTLLPVFVFSRAGIPVEKFAIILTLSLFFIAIGILIYKPPVFPFIRYLPFALIFLIALWVTGKPLLQFGFNWLSYCNDDMTNYCLRAQRFLHYGYSSFPNINSMLQGKDYSLYFWFMDIPSMTRAGADLLLAWGSASAKLTPHQIFMPVTLALDLCLISSAGALICTSHRYRNAALLTCFILAFSALISLGSLYQLIAQVGGLSLLMGTIIWLFRPFSQNFPHLVLKNCIALTTLISALLIFYPEITPFLIFSYVAYLLLNLVHGWRPNKKYFFILGWTLLFCLILLNTYWVNYFYFLSYQASYGKAVLNSDASFPYYLVPSGLANIWGFQALSVIYFEPWNSFTILLGAGLLVLVTAICAWLALKKRHPAAIVTLVMLGLAVDLFSKNIGFGLFKLMMYIQPFMLGALVTFIFATVHHVFWRVAPIVLLAILNLDAQNFYVDRSRSIDFGSFTEVGYASRPGISAEFENVIKQISPSKQIIIDTNNLSLFKIQAFGLYGHKSIFLNFPGFVNFIVPFTINDYFYLFPKTLGFIDKGYKSISDNLIHLEFNMHDSLHSLNPFLSLKNLNISDTANRILVGTSARQTIFNRFELKSDSPDFTALSWDKVKNHLIFIGSSLGEPYYSFRADVKMMSIFRLENDIFYPQQTMAAIGRYLLFFVANPSDISRLELNVSDTLSGDGNTKLPPITAIGLQRQLLPIVGYGSARVYSAPVSLQTISKSQYLMIDMGIDGHAFKVIRTGFMKAYGGQVSLDHRPVVAFARDISLVSEDEYENLKPPSFLSNFPADLSNKELEYSGIYEDGWIGNVSYFVLSQPKNENHLRIKGMVPKIDPHVKSITLTVFLDGKKLPVKSILVGNFNVDFPVQFGTGDKRKIELTFSLMQNLPNGDDRPVSAKINFLGFGGSKA